MVKKQLCCAFRKGHFSREESGFAAFGIAVL